MCAIRKILDNINTVGVFPPKNQRPARGVDEGKTLSPFWDYVTAHSKILVYKVHMVHRSSMKVNNIPDASLLTLPWGLRHGVSH
jgi:hypothetical protein